MPEHLPTTDPQVRLEGIGHDHAGACIFDNVTLSIATGQSCAIIGASGCGKSTLLNIIGLLDRPTTGKLTLAGQDVTHLDANKRAILRNRHLGFVFQGFNLLTRLDALDNVALPLRYRGEPVHRARQAARQRLASVGLERHAHHLPAQLSGGQRQKVAIARALVGEPALLLADEPTGSLDASSAANIIDLLLELNRTLALTLMLVTHDPVIARRMQRCMILCNGGVHET